MANTKNAEKRTRQALKHRAINRAGKSRIVTASRKLEGAIASGDKAAAEQSYSDFTSVLDKAAKQNFISINAASRRKSRLHTRVSAMA
ncbi:MAG: 30S ribosomal protein S20 [Lentisphaerae bacterium]|jgi:small subunit ribosomal protein S20|nr:30S ribosomal protein S20 [Lentisphaerota bacterium]